MAFSFSERVMRAWKRCKSSETFRPHSFALHLPCSDVLESHEVLWGGLFPSMSIHCDNADYKISKTNKNEWCKKRKEIKGILNISLTFLIEHSCYLFFPEFFGGRGDWKRQAIMGSITIYLELPFPPTLKMMCQPVSLKRPFLPIPHWQPNENGTEQRTRDGRRVAGGWKSHVIFQPPRHGVISRKDLPQRQTRHRQTWP